MILVLLVCYKFRSDIKILNVHCYRIRNHEILMKCGLDLFVGELQKPGEKSQGYVIIQTVFLAE